MPASDVPTGSLHLLDLAPLLQNTRSLRHVASCCLRRINSASFDPALTKKKRPLPAGHPAHPSGVSKRGARKNIEHHVFSKYAHLEEPVFVIEIS